jgi:hypothetical protein
VGLPAGRRMPTAHSGVATKATRGPGAADHIGSWLGSDASYRASGAPQRQSHVERPVTKSQMPSINLGENIVTAKQAVTLAYTYRVLIQRHGHLLLHLDVTPLTKGLHSEFWYGDCGIRYVNVLDYIGGAQQPRISQLPASGPMPNIQISYDGRVLPKGGMAFVWGAGI